MQNRNVGKLVMGVGGGGRGGGSTRMPVLFTGPCLYSLRDHLCMRNRNVGERIMHVLLKGPSIGNVGQHLSPLRTV